MNPAVSALLIGLMLILPLSSLVARRLPLGSVLRMVLLWVAIFALAIIAVLAWQSFMHDDEAPFVKDVAAVGVTWSEPPYEAQNQNLHNVYYRT